MATAHNETQANGGHGHRLWSVSFGYTCGVCVFVFIHACCLVFGCDINEQPGS